MDEPSVLQKMKMGAIMGGTVGLTMGFLFGSYAIMRNGAGPRGFVATLSQYMLASGASFAFFLSIGSVIRTDNALGWHAPSLATTQPILRSRADGAALTRARWNWERQRQSLSRPYPSS